jgi:hypothetical protein
MPRQPWLMDVISDAFRGVKGFRVDAYPGWQTRGSTIFNPNHVMDHHTGAGAYNNLLRYMAEGPVHPPLCNVATSRPSNGVVRITVVAAGRANHAGRGNFQTIPVNQGNRYSIGIENQNDGRQSWPQQQVEAMRRLDAALLRHLGRGTDFMLDHKTYAPGRKVDRHTFHVPTERIAVSRMLSDTRPPAPAPAPERTWFDMASKSELREVVREVLSSERDLLLRERANESIRLDMAACLAGIAAIRAAYNLDPDPASDLVHVQRIRAGEHGNNPYNVETARKRLEDHARKLGKI